MSVDYLSAINRQGSGLNITEIVDSLVEAETAPQVDRIQKISTRKMLLFQVMLVASELDKFKSFTDLLLDQVHLMFHQIHLPLVSQ